MKNKKNVTLILSILILITISFSGCAYVGSEVNELNGSITGNTYLASFYTNEGEKFMDMTGQKINLSANIVKEPQYSSDGGWGYTKTLSSVVTITIDGNEVESCGSTIIFAEDGLTPEVDFKNPEIINSTTDGSLEDNTLIAGIVNKYKNYYGKPRVIVVQSEWGNLICAYSGDKVYWEVCQDLPKTTKLMIDGKALYIHQATFQIFDKNMLK